MPTRGQRKDLIAEDVKHVLEKSWRVEEEDFPHKIFTREAKKKGSR